VMGQQASGRRCDRLRIRSRGFLSYPERATIW
jgi:hypothetical protein